MRQGMRVVGLEGLVKRFRDHPGLIAREQTSVVRQEARALCVGYGMASEPGFNNERVEKFRARVETEVRRVFPTKHSRTAVYRLVLRRSNRLAAAYLRASAVGNEAQVRKILQEAGVAIESLNPALHKAARTGKHGSVAKNYQGDTVVSETQARAYAKRKASLVGVAQAGWYAAAKGLGGRVRRNLNENGKRSTEEIFPGHVRKLARKFPGLGGARVTVQGSRTTVEIFTNVKHATNALSDAKREEATSRAQISLGRALAESVRMLNRKQFKRSA